MVDALGAPEPVSLRAGSRTGASDRVPSARSWAQRMVRFAAVSGVGWLLDFCIFAMLVHQGLAPGPSNAIGAGAAVVWVFFSSVRHIFRYRGASLHSRFVGYVIYQVLMIAMASLGVATLVRFAGIDALLAKALVTPLTFLANFLFMAWLTGPESRST